MIINEKVMLKNLFCSSCATKIENNIKKMPELESAEYNFSTQILKISFKNIYKREKILEKIKNIVDTIEDGVDVFYLNEANNNVNTSNKKKLILLILSTTLFISSFFINNNFKIIFIILSYIISGYPIIIKSIKNIQKGDFMDENFLMTIATLGAFSIKEYPEAAGVMLFYQIGEFMQDLAVNSSRKSIQDLLNIKATYANLFKNETIIKVSPEELKISDIIIVKNGETIPADGEIIEGKSYFDTSSLTGEYVKKYLKTGDNVLSGFINTDRTVKIKIKKMFTDSTIAKILELVEDAASKKAKTEKFITKFAKYYTPFIVYSALVIAFIIPLFLGNFSTWFYRALIFLVVSCPCALVVSIPLGFFAGIGRNSKNGVLIKGGNYLELLSELDTIIFDKTGTLTKGEFKVVEITGDILEITAYAENYSNHPIAEAIIKKYNKKIDINKIQKHQEIAGYGISAKIFNKSVLVGNKKLMQKYNVSIPKINKNGTIIYTAINNEFQGYIIIDDIIKTESFNTIKSLKSNNISTIMLTGDSEKVANYVSTKLSIDKYYADLLPHEKAKIFKEIKNKKNKVAFVGDGINDAPVLAMSDVGIAMGGIGSDAAIASADIVLMDDNPYKIIEAIKISKFTKNIILQNIIFALSTKILVLILSLFGVANMWFAIFADVGVALLAILNSTRILKEK
ncbi:Cd2+/Zn2+-exporting ATPase [Hypnocyclicus thermotrophus]|uniref:Cd2+/Zn2+-exporting ATPase n=1 Tax=Hypnocyclicus thermotrophus TaxID=1627895 RepID=A0AA46I6R4_9FUSO|nr:heavy metal translocating P-type ATPase [Hypnocyclicus thermotrophus]TDT72567.1 Cd2+/Zn2+-exporting ATPase [Hypnocyclicus thermotrophus]